MSAADPLKSLDTVAGAGPTIKFPYDVEAHGHFVQIACYAREHSKKPPRGAGVMRGHQDFDKALGVIYLPMPASLQTQYSITYANEDMGPIGEAVAGVAAGGTANIVKAANAVNAQLQPSVGWGPDDDSELPTEKMSAGKFMGALGSGAKSLANSLYDDVVSGFSKTTGANAVDTLLAYGVSQGPSHVKAGIAAARGVVNNPHRVVLFQGVQFREQQFAYRLSPRSREETESINALINKLRIWMHPKFSSSGLIKGATTKRNFLTYPHIFKIKFSQDEYLFGYKPCILKTFNVQYHPQGYAAYIRDDSSVAPAEVEISMTFQEMDMWDSDAFAAEGEKKALAQDVRGLKKASESLIADTGMMGEHH